MAKLSEETRKRMSEAAKQRWQRIKGGYGPETEEYISNRISKAMKRFWKTRSRAERLAIAKKAAETRRANREAKRD